MAIAECFPDCNEAGSLFDCHCHRRCIAEIAGIAEGSLGMETVGSVMEMRNLRPTASR